MTRLDRTLKIAVSDYPGHAFPAQLSRTLARRGHDVLHLSYADFQSPKGRVAAESPDPPGFTAIEIRTDRPFDKSSFVHRRRQEREVGRKLGEAIRRFGPDLILSGNAPLDTQAGVERVARKLTVPYLFWMQDVYSDAIGRILRTRFGLLGELVGIVYRRVERNLLRRAAHVIVIADAFLPAVASLTGRRTPPVTVIENWAPLEDLGPLPRDNDWAIRHLTSAPVRLVYSGTLGFKHNPDLIAALARGTGLQVEVFSEGPAADHLRAIAEQEGLTNLTVRGWVAVADLPSALAAADILLAILEPDAGAFSVPSKVLSYLATGRAILGAIPADNLAAQLIQRNGAGLVVDPGDPAALVRAALRLASDAMLRVGYGRAGRAYAERAFDINAIAARFEDVFAQALDGDRPAVRA